jgi:hypothetical protein
MVWIKLFFSHVLMFFIFYYYFISPIKMEIFNALHTESQLSQELVRQKKSYVRSQKAHEKIYFTHHTQEALIKYFMNKIISSKFLVEEIYPIQIRKHKNLIEVSFRLTLSGSIFQLKNLIDQLSEDRVLININEVVVKSNSKMVMKIDVFNVSDEETTKHYYVLQWIGYTEKNKIIKGLLRMENGDVLEVEVGSVINKTLKILKITKDQMLIQVDNRVFIIKYGQSLKI